MDVDTDSVKGRMHPRHSWALQRRAYLHTRVDHRRSLRFPLRVFSPTGGRAGRITPCHGAHGEPACRLSKIAELLVRSIADAADRTVERYCLVHHGAAAPPM